MNGSCATLVVMELTKTERLILYNQYAILEKLDPEQAEYCAQVREILSSGYVLEYYRFTQGVFDEFPAERSTTVRDIFDMYDMLGYAYKQLADKTGIKASDISFLGFSGNEETEYMAYARFLKRIGLWASVDTSASDDLNSHIPMLPKYRIMLSRWNASTDRHQLTKDDITRIVAPIDWKAAGV